MTPVSTLRRDMNDVRSTLESLSRLSDADLQEPTPAAQFHEAVQAMADLVRDEHSIDEATRPYLTVTHYTSLDALFSMLQDPEEPRLRLYDTMHLNDPREGIASEEGRSLADYLPAATFPHQHDGSVARFGTAYVLSFLSGTEGDNPGDDLMFWRLYGRDGRGCSISFVPYLKPWPDSVRNGLRRVRYHPNDMTDYGTEIIALLKLLNRYERLANMERLVQQELSQAMRPVEECLARRFLVKEPPYRLENEVRLVRFASSSTKEPSVELVRGAIRHYLEDDNLKLRQLVDTRCVLRLGPAVPHAEDARRALHRLWNKRDLPSITIKTSAIEYRSSL